MTVPRLLTGTVVVAAALVAGGPSAWATGEDGPGTNDLQLQVERLEHASQADVTGAEASAMLFVPRDAEAMAATEAARQESRTTATGSLFVTSCDPYRAPGSTESLFTATATDGGTDAVAGTSAAESGDAQPGSSVPWALAGLGVLLAGGLTLSYLVREPEADPHG